jgi:hypothetical protein
MFEWGMFLQKAWSLVLVRGAPGHDMVFSPEFWKRIAGSPPCPNIRRDGTVGGGRTATSGVLD